MYRNSRHLREWAWADDPRMSLSWQGSGHHMRVVPRCPCPPLSRYLGAIPVAQACPQSTTYDFTQRPHSISPAPAFPMSTNIQTTGPSAANFTAILDAASKEYKILIGQDLQTHPLAAALDNFSSPESVLNVFRRQAQAFDKFRKGDDKLIAWLTPVVNILFTFSGTLGEGVGLVSIQSIYDISVLRRLLS